MMITGEHFIAGERSKAGTQQFASHNPRTRHDGQTQFAEATAGEIERCVTAAQSAYAITRHMPAAQLADFLDQVVEEIMALGDELLQITDEETALGIPRLTGERARTTGQLTQFAGLLREGAYVEAIIDTAQPDRQPAPRPSIRRMLQPIGPVAVFSASNFPYAFATAGGDTASAWAAGCPVIVKGHPAHPMTSEYFAHAINRAIEKTGFPAGFFSLIQGSSVAVGQTLITNPGIAAVGFTGSLTAGRAIYDAAAARPTPIPVYAEMGSVNPVVILPGALAARSADLVEGLVGSVTMGTGQFCTNPGIVFMMDDDATAGFIDGVVEKMRETQPGVLLNPQIQQGLSKAVSATAARQGVENLLGGHELDTPACGYAHTVLKTRSDFFRADHALHQEHFGPVTLFVLCESADDLLLTLNALEGNLTATIHAETDEIEAAGALLGILREKVGRLIWNGFPTGVEVVYAMQHGGPYPATTAPATTSVGMTAIKRFMRPVAYQNMPDALLPDALKDANPLGIWRTVDNALTRQPLDG
ncbi:MAG: aldehyde dehydrogenase (NADP(+)) [Anaerolineaceae bacterium]|nr:MAG: aldehyde dehydrogenase (NADP(+)) [Anaerolineaceae bacterium]